MPNLTLGLLAALALTLSCKAAEESPVPAVTPAAKPRAFKAVDVFDVNKPVMFQDHFAGPAFDKWTFSENDQYRLSEPHPERIEIRDAPGLPSGRKAVRFAVDRAPDSFRSELSLPSESGFRERWYSELMLIPEEWVFDPARDHDIVMQWHALPGNGKPTHPNLALSVQDNHWFLQRVFGSPQTNPTRIVTKLDDPVQKGVWVSWVIHAKWSPRDDGVLQIWKDGKLTVDLKGPNVYGTIGIEYTPYLKTGIYHPEWHLNDDRKKEAFAKAQPVSTRKVVWVTEVKVGSEKATYADMAPRRDPQPETGVTPSRPATGSEAGR